MDIARGLGELQGPVIILVKSQMIQRCQRNQVKNGTLVNKVYCKVLDLAENKAGM